MLYLFAVIFGFAYGGEVPQMPALINQFFGLQAVTTLLGAVLLGTTFGGALGSWIGGQIFDVLHSYQVAFITAVIAAILAAFITIILRNTKSTIPRYHQSIVSWSS
jgi:MFS family permease